ncbi:MAG: NADH-quinone oxidoreductase subunit C/D [Alphaproteobacteria bacterium]|jgi:NADH-quinone oxidoreductase subunit C/D|nr:NADH-quinone oxidoreductase subunit C/D [Alphaproteobacteria bacterium]
MRERDDIASELRARFGGGILAEQATADGTPTLWASRDVVPDLLRHLKTEAAPRYRMLFDLYGIDERERTHRDGQPAGDFTLVYHLLSLDQAEEIRIKVPLADGDGAMPSLTGLWPNAAWYEREAWDMFGIGFSGHPDLRRILMPPTWQGHPLRKDHYARATEGGPYTLPGERRRQEEEALAVDPSMYGLEHDDAAETMILNLGPNHPSVHGVFRVILQLDGEEIVAAVPDIGYHHRGAEKMGERQSWHTYIPYTDRVDYLGGVMNNLPYVMAVERLAGIEVPERVRVIRIMLAELFRIASHLVFYGTMAQDVGALSPVFYMFTDREKVFDVVEAICGFRMHPGWFRIGGVAQDLPAGWEGLVHGFLDYMPRRMDEYDKLVLQNLVFRQRTRGVGAYTTDEAIDWGVTGPGLRATGLDWDLRKVRPYGGYDRFDFDVPTAANGDCYDRTLVRAEEIRQSLRIVRQCVDTMPAGDYKARHPLTTPPLKERTMHDIETLITHFLGVSWGPVIPPGEASVMVEATKGLNAYSLISDGGTMSYRTRIRTPSFPHLQMIPLMCRGSMVPDLIAVLGSIDFVLADVDR